MATRLRPVNSLDFAGGIMYNRYMLKMCCFASGSKGNCCYVSDGETDILIDLGISASRVDSCLAALGVEPDRLNVLITHAHSDHVNGIKVFGKKHRSARFHCQRECAQSVIMQTGVIPTVDEREFTLGALSVQALPVPHDVPCFGYIVKSGERAVAVVTDVGCTKPDLLDGLCSCDLVMLEANHDLTRLRLNPSYSAQLKRRISSEHGHLSNDACASACAFLAEHGVKNFILAHLSEENNAPELALAAVRAGLCASGITDARIVTASQNKPTGLFEVC